MIIRHTSPIVFVCTSKACAPPPVGQGGSNPSKGGGSSGGSSGGKAPGAKYTEFKAGRHIPIGSSVKRKNDEGATITIKRLKDGNYQVDSNKMLPFRDERGNLKQMTLTMGNHKHKTYKSAVEYANDRMARHSQAVKEVRDMKYRTSDAKKTRTIAEPNRGKAGDNLKLL